MVADSKSEKSRSRRERTRKRGRKRGRSSKDEGPKAKQPKVAPILTEEQKKENREKLKKLPKRNKKRGAIEDLRKITAAKARSMTAKPMFISKKKRAMLEKKEGEQKKNKERKFQEKVKRLRKDFLDAYDADDSRTRRGDGGRKSSSRRGKEEKKKDKEFERRAENAEKEYNLIKLAYLGKKKKKQNVLPPSQKFKFNFDWDAGEDTSEVHNKLYKDKHQISLMCGNGSFGGYDQDKQLTENKSRWTRLLARTGREQPQYSKQRGGLHEVLEQKRSERKRRLKKKEEDIVLKYRHWSKKKLPEMKARDWRIFKEDFRISTKFGGKLPYPIRFWDESGLPDSIMNAIRDAGYRRPYPIQRQGIPVGIMNRDCVGIAETGSGKTAAFVIPMLVYIMKQPPMTQEIAGDGPYALILAPTRELATQIEGEVVKFAKYLEIKSMVIVGGVNIHMQSALAAHGVEVIIATPGRLLDSLQKRFLALNQCKYIVLDEADRMIDMGFSPDVESILERMPVSNLRPLDDDDAEQERIYRQTFMFTATMPSEVQRMAKKYLRNPVYIQIGDPNETAAKNVTQHVQWTTDSTKRKALQELLDSLKIEPPIMIFMNMKKACETLVRFLRDQDYNAEALHGGRIQEQRVAALKRFHDGVVDILVCTDVASRGIDVKGVNAVINYDMTKTIDIYCHRIGRTGRAESKGSSYTFITEHDAEVFYDLRQILLKGGFSLCRELDRHEMAHRNPKALHKRHGPKVIYKS